MKSLLGAKRLPVTAELSQMIHIAQTGSVFCCMQLPHVYSETVPGFKKKKKKRSVEMKGVSPEKR